MDAAAGEGLREADEAEPERFTRAEIEAAVLAVREQLAQASREPVRELLGWSIEATRATFHRLQGVGDFAGALRAADQIRKLAEAKDKLQLDEED